MIRAFYNFQSVHSTALINNAGNSLSSDGIIFGNINTVRNEPAICIDPYARLKQGIVPDKGCYTYLRSASCYVNEGSSSPVFPYGNTKKDKLSKLSRDIKYEKLIVDALLHEIKVKGDIVQSLQHIQVGKRLPTDSNTGIFTKYCPCVLKSGHQWSGLVLVNCRDEIIKCSNQLITPSLELMEPSPGHDWSGWHQIALHIEDAEVNKSTLNSIFKSFNKVFNESIISTSFLVAVVATYLRDYWYSTPPNNIKRNAIVACTSQYSELFVAGEIIIDLLSDDNIKITIDKELAFMYWFDKVDCKLK